MSMGLGNNFDRAQRAYDNQLPPDEPDKIECDKCEGTGKLPMSDCCEGAITSENVQGHILMYCDSCHDLCEQAKCDKCKGEGEVWPEKSEPDYEPEDCS